MKETCLITGGAGFIGAHVTRELIKNHYKTIVLDDLSGGFEENIPPEAQFIKGSITDHELVNKIFEENKISYVFHFAAYAAEGLSHFIKRFNYTNNLIGSVNLINASVNFGVKCFVFTSSIAVYGTNQLPMKESTVPLPEDPYGIAKFAVELDLKETHEMFGLNYIIFRPHNVYGEYQNIGDKYRNVIGIFINNLMQDKPMTIFGDGEQTRAFSYIGDLAPIISRSIEVKEAYNDVFNIGADTPYTINQLAEVIARVMKKPINKIHLDARNEVLQAYADHEKAKAVFDYKSQYDLEYGIKRQVEWALKVGSKKSNDFSDIEVEKNLPSIWRGN